MNARRQEMDRLFRRAEQKAASFDPMGLTEAVEALGDCLTESLQDTTLSRAEVLELHERLVSFHDLCGFLQETLQHVLLGAAQVDAPPSPYGAVSRRSSLIHMQPLLRRYA